MKTYTRDQILEMFDTLSQPDRPMNNIAHARRNNSASDYDSDELLKHGKRTVGKRARSSLSVLSSFAGREV